MTHGVANIVDLFHWERGDVEELLWADDVDVLTVVGHFTDEGNILETKYSKLFLLNIVLAENEICLQIKGSLTKDCSDQSSRL